MIRELWELIDELNEKPDDFGEPYFSQQRYYKPFELSSNKFNKYNIDNKDERVVCCVDGGNNTIYETPSESIHLLRIYFNIFKGKKRVINIDPQSYFLISQFDEDSITIKLKKINDSIPQKFNQLTLQKDDIDEGKITNTGHTVRKYLEWDVIKCVSEEYLDEGSIIIKDGVLQTGVEEERKFAESAYNSIENNNIYLVGLAKTCSLRTTKGFPLIAAVQELSRNLEIGRWYYHPLAENNHPDHMGEMMVVKYHPNSNYVFRTEFYRKQDPPVEDILGYLAYQAQDPAFLGYPYGLVDADKRARVTDDEIDYLKNIGLNKMGKIFRNKLSSMDAHDKLSNL